MIHLVQKTGFSTVPDCMTAVAPNFFFVPRTLGIRPFDWPSLTAAVDNLYCGGEGGSQELPLLPWPHCQLLKSRYGQVVAK